MALLTGLLIGGFADAGAAPADRDRPATRLAVRLAPPVVTAGEPAALVGQLSTARPRALVLQRRAAGGTWRTVARTSASAAGRSVVPLDTSVAGRQVLRLVAHPSGRRPQVSSPPVTLTVATTEACAPRVPLVDLEATSAARCLAARLDRWRSARLMAVGQQLNVSNSDYLGPLRQLAGRRVGVVGFDLLELARGESYGFADPPLARLAQLARDGAVLSASWHPDNPHTGGGYDDRGWTSLGALLDPRTAEHQRFWSDYATSLGLLRRLQDAGVAVVFRPLHEANGDWFWWGRPDPATYRALWAAMQQAAREAGVHNIVWAYGFNADTGAHIGRPAALLPGRVDLAGIDSYDPEAAAGTGKDALDLTGYAAVAARVDRMAITEAGPHDSVDGAWDPAVIGRAARAQRSRPLWAMLWFDDGGGRKQLGSLAGGRRWLDSCPNALCRR